MRVEQRQGGSGDSKAGGIYTQEDTCGTKQVRNRAKDGSATK